MSGIIFLDIDGVLNPHQWDPLAQSNRIDRDKVLLLNRILGRTGAKIVLSSAWRYLVNRDEMTLAGLDWLLRSHGIKAGCLIGITHPDTPVEWDEDLGVPIRFVEDERGKQISRWLAKNAHRGPYVVIDDGGKRADGSWTDMGITAADHPFVRTDGDRGLTEADAEEAVRILRWGFL